MDPNRFETPVTIFTGLGFPTMIESVAESYARLADGPKESRDAAHRMALGACRVALAGEIDAETARGTFLAFARKANLLAPAVDDLVAAHETGVIGARQAV